MKVRLSAGTIMAGPGRVATGGQVIDVELEEAEALIQGGYAHYVGDTPVRPKASEVPDDGPEEAETAVAKDTPVRPKASEVPDDGPEDEGTA